MTCVLRRTYFLLANGCSTSHARPGSSPSHQFSALYGTANGGWPVAVSFGIAWVAVALAADCCCATADRVKTPTKTNVRETRVFINASFLPNFLDRIVALNILLDKDLMATKNSQQCPQRRNDFQLKNLSKIRIFRRFPPKLRLRGAPFRSIDF